MPVSIPLGTTEQLTGLYSYPNTPGSSDSLPSTVLHWFMLTLKRDGIGAEGASARMILEGTAWVLVLDGPPQFLAGVRAYQTRLPQFLANGLAALTTVVPQLKTDGKWDPSPDPSPPPYRPWRFFLPLGMAMLNQKSLQFFHYPPIRLLEGTRDYLADPVPVRWEELLTANGVSQSEVLLHNTVVDATPIAAEDDQGSKQGGDPTYGLIPIQYFPDYQKAQVALLLNDAPGYPGYTVPIVVYGSHPNQIFSKLYNIPMGNGKVAVAEIVPGKKTPVLGSQHPYVFYAVAQGFPTVGSGKFLSAAACAAAARVTQTDLATARWQMVMAADPTQDPRTALDACVAYWADPSRAGTICALTRHQASLYYASPESLQFTYPTSLTDAAAFCATHGNQTCAGVTG
jgi:hypothetical protein